MVCHKRSFAATPDLHSVTSEKYERCSIATFLVSSSTIMIFETYHDLVLLWSSCSFLSTFERRRYAEVYKSHHDSVNS